MIEYVKKAIDRLQNTKAKNHNMSHIAGQYLRMKKQSIWHHIQMKTIFLARKTPREFNIFWAPCYIIPGQLIQKKFEISIYYHESNKNEQRTPIIRPKCY